MAWRGSTPVAVKVLRDMGALAGYLKGRVVAYELWNEPNFGQYVVSQKQRDIPLVYLKLLNSGYDAVKSVARSNVVMITMAIGSSMSVGEDM